MNRGCAAWSIVPSNNVLWYTLEKSIAISKFRKCLLEGGAKKCGRSTEKLVPSFGGLFISKIDKLPGRWRDKRKQMLEIQMREFFLAVHMKKITPVIILVPVPFQFTLYSF